MQPFDDGSGGMDAGPLGESPTGDPSAPDESLAFDVPLPESFGGDVSAKEAALRLLVQLQESSGLDLLTLLSDISPVPGPTQTREGVQVPGTGESPGLELSESDTDDLVRELCDIVDREQRAKEPLMAAEQDIRDAYRMARGEGPSSGASSDEQMVSEFMMVQVDQITARLVTNITSVDPLVKVDPVKGSSYDDPNINDLATKSQNFLCQYTHNDMDFRHLLPQTVHRAVKVGTAVLRIAWKEEEVEKSFYPKGESREKTERQKLGSVDARLFENRQVIIWPPTCLNWQRDYEVVGHESWHSRSSWKRLASNWKLTEEKRALIEANPGERDDKADEAARGELDTQQMEGQKTVDAQFKFTELWCRLWLPAPHNRTVKFQVIIHRPTKTLCWAGLNPHFTRKHPYFPVRYKWSDLSAWGTGAGHEALNCWAVDTALWSLTMENLAAGAFSIVIRNANSAHAVQARPVRPGMEVVSNDPTNDYIVRKMGGEAQELTTTRQENADRLKRATGTPDVAMGVGDSTMKSGAGTGSTLALIEQAGMKVRFIDQTLREDLTPIFEFIFELAAQYGDEGIFFNSVGAKDASVLERIRYTPPRGDISSVFRIQAMAPSAATSTEARRNNMMVIWGFASEAVQVMNTFATPLLQQQNPAGLARWQLAVANTLHAIMRRVLELHEVPGLMSIFPEELPEQTPADEQINELQAELQQAYTQLQGLEQELQQLTQPQPQPGMPGQPQPGQPQPAQPAPQPMPAMPSNGAAPTMPPMMG